MYIAWISQWNEELINTRKASLNQSIKIVVIIASFLGTPQDGAGNIPGESSKATCELVPGRAARSEWGVV